MGFVKGFELVYEYSKLYLMVYCLESESGSGCLMQCCLVYCLVFVLEFEYWKLFGLVYCLGFG